MDGDYDMGVIGHEYGHMIENRMIGKGASRSGHHAGAMGESFGDFDAMEYLNANGFVPTGDENPFAIGTYATGNKVRAIRNYGMNFPTSGGVPEPSQQLSINALNFSDMGYDVTGPQVHADGEIWSKTNFAIRQLLINKYNSAFPASDADLQYSCANGELPVQSCPGNRRWIQIVYDSMLLMPTNPSMLQARDAQLAADLMRFGGANQTELWLGFARQGFGRNATSSNTTANTDTDPTPDFEPIGTAPANVTFRGRVVGGGNASVIARIFVGHYEGRVSPIADTDPATIATPASTWTRSPTSHRARTSSSPARPGYGHVRFQATFRSGQTRTITIRFVENWASTSQGAFASGDTSGTTPAAQATQLMNLIDDIEATNWTTAGTVTSGNLSVAGKRVTVDLSGVNDRRISLVQVSAMLGAGQSRFTALREFELWACNAAEGANCASDAGYTLEYTSPGGRLPGRPAAARGTAADPEDVRRLGLLRDASASRREDEPVHGRPRVPGRSGRRPGEQRRLRLERHADLGVERRPRSGAAGVQQGADRRGRTSQPRPGRKGGGPHGPPPELLGSRRAAGADRQPALRAGSRRS